MFPENHPGGLLPVPEGRVMNLDLGGKGEIFSHILFPVERARPPFVFHIPSHFSLLSLLGEARAGNIKSAALGDPREFAEPAIPMASAKKYVKGRPDIYQYIPFDLQRSPIAM